MLINILAASIDGLVSGVVITGIQTKTGLKDFFKVFSIVFLCCFSAAYTGFMLAIHSVQKYTALASVIILFYLSARPFLCSEEAGISDLYAVSFSIAADASVVCIMLAAEGYSIILTSFLSAAIHSMFLFGGIKFSKALLRKKLDRYTDYFSSLLFFIMAVYKLCTI